MKEKEKEKNMCGVNIVTNPPEELDLTNCSLRFLLFVNIHAARGFCHEFIDNEKMKNKIVIELRH